LQSGDPLFQATVNGEIPARQLADFCHGQVRVGERKAPDGFLECLGQAVTVFAENDVDAYGSQELEVAVKATDIETKLPGEPFALPGAVAKKM
jgi:hypothetical protein